MKLLRYGEPGTEKPAILDANGQIRDLSSLINNIDGSVLQKSGLSQLEQLDVETLPVVGQPCRIGVPVAGIGKLVGIGLNYQDHAREAGLTAPSEPIIFLKAITSLCGPNDDVIRPRQSTKLDWEVELGVVIGTKAQYVSEDNALDYVAGYCIGNDVSERAFQIDGTGQWTKGKSADTFCPLGPWLVTKDEIPDPQNLRLWLEVNGINFQDGTTQDMVFPVTHLVSFVSRFMTLMPGDVILTGTPSGVGFGLKPPVYLKAGDTMRLGVEGLGEQIQRVVNAEK